jgi:large subunit ribosomal protein L16
MLVPKKVKYRKWQTGRKNQERDVVESKGTNLDFGSFGLKSIGWKRVKSNQIEAARKVLSRTIGKSGKMWIRIFPDRPFTAKPAEVKLGKGKGDVQGYCFEVRPGRIIFEIDGVDPEEAKEGLRKAGAKLPVKTKIVQRPV